MRSLLRRCVATSSLRILEEAARKPKVLKDREKAKIIKSLRSMLACEENVTIAIIHGGFAYSNIFRDLDLSIYVDSPPDELTYVDELKEKLEKHLKIGIDIQLLNSAPPKFMIKVLEKGVPLLERRPGLKAILKLHAIEENKKIKRGLTYLLAPEDTARKS